jgi:hexosaminidase
MKSILFAALSLGMPFTAMTAHAAEPVSTAVSAPTPAAQASDLNLIPWPAKLSRSEGRFSLTEKTAVVADTAFVNEAGLLAGSLALPISAAAQDGAIRLVKTEGIAAEGYTLTVTPSGATITASTPAGAFYGTRTLLQLSKNKYAPCVEIRDEPRIAWRGFMLDVSRHFFDKDEVKARLDEMAELKLNVFHWHLTDDHGWRIEIKKYPKLTEVGAWHPITGGEKNSKYAKDGRYGGFYTQDDIREIVAYAAKLHIRILPEIDMPGHMSAAATAYPELSPDNGWTPVVSTLDRAGNRCSALSVARPQTMKFCKEVLEEVIALFPSKEIHVGGDEVFSEQWQACPEMRAYKDKLKLKHWDDVQIVFQNEISEFLIGKGRTAVFWNNIYRQTVDKRSINHFWRNMNNARDFANNDFDVLMSPYVYYLDHREFSPEATYKYDPLAIGVKAGAEKRMIGIEACQWTERIPDENALVHNIYPRLIAMAESGWTPQENKNWDSFRHRLVECSGVPEFCRADAAQALKDAAANEARVAKEKAAEEARRAARAKLPPVPVGNLACWKSARLLNKEGTKEIKASAATNADAGIDGNPDTVAQPAGKGPSVYDVDLGKVTSIGRVAVTFGKNAYPTRFDIAVSDDGVVWRTVLEKKAHDGAKAEVRFTPVDARFVQILGLTPAKAETPMAVAELEVYSK